MSPEAALSNALDRVRIIATENEREEFLACLLDMAAHDTVVVDFLNQHGGNMLGRHAEFRENFMAADVILRDGIGTRLAFALRRQVAGLNMNGTDLIPRITALFAGCSDAPSWNLDAREQADSLRKKNSAMIYFGTCEPWLSAGAEKLIGAYIGPIVMRDGFQSDDNYLAAVRPYRNHNKLIVLGMGMPRQEEIAQRLKRADIGPALILCGGAIIDFAGGRFSRAPRWMRASGLEWLFRLIKEPRRLFGRYVIGIPVFLLTTLRATRRARVERAGTDRAEPNNG